MKLFLTFLLTLVLVSCKEEARIKKVPLSPNGKVCITLPESFSYQFLRRGIDHVDGTITAQGAKFEVYVGFQPPFPTGRWPNQNQGEDGFEVVGKSIEREKQIIVFGSKSEFSGGPIFVMITGQDLDPLDALAREKRLLIHCGN